MKRFLAVSFCLVLSVVALGAQSRSAAPFKARLSPLGVTGATVNTITGLGAVTATLTGATLAIDGTFEGLTGVATAANVRRGPKAIPGPVVFDLEFTKASSGHVSGTLTLTPEQIADLNAGRLYVQIHSERAPDGSIRGWLLK
ncbi:MAG: CHRD domain-containing protein [Acidobacteriaceae bacterium]|jgi:hypothetical protein|nr:CHRD domain-containing protein [Acidobacteriaceae bacterium]